MFGSPVLTLVIGLAFIYVLLSLICTGINEWIAQLVKLRSKTLAEGIESLLTDATIREQVYHHPLIESLSKNGKTATAKEHEHPSHIPPENFALAVLDTAAALGRAAESDDAAKGTSNDGARFKTFDELEAQLNLMPESELRTALLALVAKSERKIDKLLTEIESWFDNTMDRVSEWYKRKAQAILVVLALLLTVSLNADTLIIAKNLWQDQELRESVADAAALFVEQNPNLGRAAQPAQTTTTPDTTSGQVTQPADTTGAQTPTVQESAAQLQALDLPLGWSKDDLPRDLGGWLAKILGLFLTVIAVSQGAPFWFNLLNKLVNLRATGKVTEEKKAKKE